MLKINEIREMIKMVEESSIQSFEHETTRIVIVKNDLASTRSTLMEIEPPNADLTVKQVDSECKEVQLHQIISPMVGTFFSAPEPGADPFVKVDQIVDSNTVVCVLEAMKLLNEIDAGVDGKIVEILVKDGDFVEYRQPLFLIRKGD